MIDDIRKNIDTEIGMLKEVVMYSKRIKYADSVEKRLLLATIKALVSTMRIINSSIPSLLNEVTVIKKLPSERAKKSDVEKVKYGRAESEINVAIPSKYKHKLLKELGISEGYIKKLKKRGYKDNEEYVEFKAARGYLKLANKFFLDNAINWISKGYFKPLSKQLKKANIEILFQGYVAMMFMTTFLSAIIAIFLTLFLLFFDIGLLWPFLSFYEGSYLSRFLKIFWIPLVVPIATFAFLYYYPNTERKTLEKRINQELPFAVIHMNAISGSGIQPSEIFRIIGLSKEYRYLRKEIRKVLNQINLYGYDLVTALNNTASSTPSEKLAELFSGVATTVTSGGNLSEFFDKRAETLLADYKLEREKHIKTAETFMDIYISIVIAAPMILMLLMIMLTAIGGLGLTIGQLTFLIIATITFINIIFLIFLHLNQPAY